MGNTSFCLLERLSWTKLKFHTTTEILLQEWALRSSKKSTRFSEPQWWYIESKFKLGQETWLKLDPVGACVVRHALCAEPAGGKTVPTVDEFLTAQQIQSYFWTRRHWDTQLFLTPVFNLCDMHDSGKLRQLSLAMLLSICEHFHIYVGNIKGRRKAPYLSLLGELLESCDCHHSPYLWLPAIIIVTYCPGSTIYL